jgi:hypothetical protein
MGLAGGLAVGLAIGLASGLTFATVVDGFIWRVHSE